MGGTTSVDKWRSSEGNYGTYKPETRVKIMTEVVMNPVLSTNKITGLD